MTKIKIILNIECSLHDEGSILKLEEVKNLYFYEPDKKMFEFNSWSPNKEFFDLFKELDDGIFLTTRKVFSFYVINTFTFAEMEFDLYNIPFNLFYEDIKDNFKIFDNKGVCRNIYQFLINEIWTSTYFGDWDNTIEYIGLINKNFKPDSIIEDKSLSRFKKRKEYKNNFYLNFND